MTHKSIRELAVTLKCLHLIEVSVVGLFCYLAWILLDWYMEITTPETFEPVAFWGAIVGIVSAIFGAVKSLSNSHDRNNK